MAPPSITPENVEAEGAKQTSCFSPPPDYKPGVTAPAHVSRPGSIPAPPFTLAMFFRSWPFRTAGGLIVLLSGLSILLYQRDPTLARENGPMENFQVVCLVLGLCVLGAAIGTLRERTGRIVLFGISLLYLTLFVHELETRKFQSRLLVALTNGRIRDLWTGALWVWGAALFLRDRVAVWQWFRRWIRSPAGYLLCAAGICWLASGAVDKSLFVIKTFFLEEIFEVNAAALMLFSAWLTWRDARRTRFPENQPNAA
jgi:hypothetical protein